MNLDVGLESKTGKRSENQDRVVHFASDLGTVFVLADGMGGHRNGGIASQMAIAECEEVFKRLAPDVPPAEALQRMIEGVNLRIYEEGRHQGSERAMGSTVVALLISETADGLLAIGTHVGDSRLYFLRDGRMFRLTEDHTLIQKLLKDGTLTESQAQDHPQSGVLTRALGREPRITVDLTSWMLLQPSDVLMLCSDGVSAYVDEEYISRSLQQEGTCQDLADRLVDLALEWGSEDNVSALVVKVQPEEAELEWELAGDAEQGWINNYEHEIRRAGPNSS